MGFLSGLNDAQRRAVDHFNGPLLVVAGAGSGKTRALTHRIAHLIAVHQVEPSEILAVTFTNKAALEMKDRLEILLAKRMAESEFNQPLGTLSEFEQRQIRNTIYQKISKEIWIGTFHSLFARLLRFDIDKFIDKEGLKWTRQFSIYDETDSLNLIKEITTQEMQLDPKRFEPKKVRWAISNAKNQGILPFQLEEKAENQREKLIADSYRRYTKALGANNALDFDDLLLIPVELLKQNKEVRLYWHTRFKHVLVDEYQDTNHTQYELIKLIVTNGEEPSTFKNWNNRSVFVVGDADQSIYSFRAADFRILMGFQADFGDESPENKSCTMVKLEENYRSTSTILDAANSLISNNKERIEKVLRATRGEGELIKLTRCDDEIAEAEAVVHKLRMLQGAHPDLEWKDMAILYRTNAQSRVIEDSLVRWGMPYIVIGGLRFYDRREIKDILSYTKFLVNPSDTISLLRILNVPKRGIGKTTIQRLTDASSQLGLPLWDIVNDQEAVLSLAGRSTKGILQFCELINSLRVLLESTKPSTLIQTIIEKSGYLNELILAANDESEERRRNLQELINAALQYEEENQDFDIEGFLASAALASNSDKDTSLNCITLMTLHSSKGLEFPIVSLVGMEQGLFPTHRSLDHTSSLEEERRLCYVGLTRAKERLFLSHATERRLWGGMREPALPSIFLSELPEELIEGNSPLSGGSAIRRQNNLDRLTRLDRDIQTASTPSDKSLLAKNAVRKINPGPSADKDWAIGDQLKHSRFGVGRITHIFGSGSKISIAVKFQDLGGPKILDPRLAPIKPL